MTRAEILTELYKSSELTEVLQRINPQHLRDDIKQHVFLVLLEKEEAFILDLYNRGKLKHYVVRVIFLTNTLSENKFVRQNRRKTEIPTDYFPCTPDEDNSDYEQLLKDVVTHTSQVYWYNQALLNMYVEEGNYRSVADKTGIPLKSVYNAVNEARKQIKKKLC